MGRELEDVWSAIDSTQEFSDLGASYLFPTNLPAVEEMEQEQKHLEGLVNGNGNGQLTLKRAHYHTGCIFCYNL